MKLASIRTRLAPVLAAVAGLGFALEGAIVVRAPQGDDHWSASGYVVEAAFVVALLAAIPVLRLLAVPGSRASRIGTDIATGGFAALLVSSAPSLALGRTVLGPAFLLGVLAALVGLVVASVPAVRRRSWSAPAACAGLVFGIGLGESGGGILLGLVWLGLAAALRERPRALVAA